MHSHFMMVGGQGKGGDCPKTQRQGAPDADRDDRKHELTAVLVRTLQNASLHQVGDDCGPTHLNRIVHSAPSHCSMVFLPLNSLVGFMATQNMAKTTKPLRAARCYVLRMTRDGKWATSLLVLSAVGPSSVFFVVTVSELQD